MKLCKLHLGMSSSSAENEERSSGLSPLFVIKETRDASVAIIRVQFGRVAEVIKNPQTPVRSNRVIYI